MADLTHDVDELERTGVVLRRGAFTRAWIDALRADLDRAFLDAAKRPGGAVNRGPERWYVELHPEALRGFVDLVSHPWIRAVSEAALGPEWEVVEIGFDVPFPGAQVQAWHRDFPSPPETWRDRRLTSLAFNVTAVDTKPEMGGFELVPGTQWDDGRDWPDGMFPPASEWHRFEGHGRLLLPQAGDVTARSALAVHRGTPNRSASPRPWLVLGVDAPGAGHAALHDLQVTRACWDRLPSEVRRHLHARVVDRLEPIVQKHQIEALGA